MTPDGRSVHASAVLVGGRGVLIRGPSGAGKSRLAFNLILAGRAGQLPAVSLIGDDRLLLQHEGSALVARPVPQLAGLLEVRGLGIRRTDFAVEGRIAVVVDLAAKDSARLPAIDALQACVASVELPRIAVPTEYEALPLVIAWFVTADPDQAPPMPA
jgi:serine kinase of HPr protein (carbohydrate metabolism regulator)